MTTTAANDRLEALLQQYRASPSGDPDSATGNVELELRYQKVGLSAFVAIMDALAEGRVPGVQPAVLEYTINAIAGTAGASGRAPGARRIHELRFAPGGARIRPDMYRTKTPLAPPALVHTGGALSYRVTLAHEATIPEYRDPDDVHLRAKARMSFLAGEWRFDLTVVRELDGVGGAQTLPAVRDAMFWAPPAALRAADVPGALLRHLGLTDARGAPALSAPEAHLYRYEVEIEHVGDTAARSALGATAARAAAHVVLEAAAPEYLIAARYQAGVYEVARHLVTSESRLQRFVTELGLKSLLPQVVAITRNDYAELFPPTGYFLGSKADGFRAVAVISGGRCAVLADQLYEMPAPANVRDLTIVDCEFVPAAALKPAGKTTKKTAAGNAAKKTAASKTAKKATAASKTAAKKPAVSGAAPFPADARLYVFDAMVVSGERLLDLPLGRRVLRIPDAVHLLHNCGLAAEPKQWVQLGGPDELEAQIRGVLDADQPFETDGLILAADGAAYVDTKSYKWKPAAQQTVDFLARRAPRAARSRPPHADAPGHELHYLFVGVSAGFVRSLGLPQPPGVTELFPRRAAQKLGTGQAANGGYGPTPFIAPDAPLAYLYQHPVGAPPIDGQVVEMRRGDAPTGKKLSPYIGDGAAEPWVLERVRHDRARELASGAYFGNDYRTAFSTWQNIVVPFPPEQLWAPTASYFRATKDRAYVIQTKYTRDVKRRLAGPLAGAGWVVDLMAGRGGDLFSWLDLGFANLIAVDADANALMELQRRRMEFARQAAGGLRIGRRAPTTLFTLEADLTQPAAATAAAIARRGLPPAGADGVLVNLGVHYLMGSEAGVANFAALCRAITRVGGTVTLTFMRGQAVVDRLSDVPTGESWDVREEGVLKYSVRRGYAKDRLEPAGQRIGVLLPFSNGEYYDEFLVNEKTLAAAMKRARFERVRAGGFLEYRTDFGRANELTEGDLAFLDLYGFAVFRRRADPRRKKAA